MSVSVMAFGAVGDGVTDDTAAFQMAYDALPNSNLIAGGQIIVPPGQYVVNNWTWGANGKTVHLVGEYGRSYLLPRGDAWAIVAPIDIYPQVPWGRHKIENICIDGGLAKEGNGVAHGTPSGIDFVGTRFYRLEVALQMNNSAYGEMYNTYFRENDVGILFSSRGGAISNPDTVLAFPPGAAPAFVANKQFRHTTFVLNRAAIVFDTPFLDGVRLNFYDTSIEASEVGVAVLPPDSDGFANIEINFKRGWFELNGPNDDSVIPTGILYATINQGDVSLYDGTVSLEEFQSLTKVTVDGKAQLDVNRTHLFEVPGGFLLPQNGGQLTSSERNDAYTGNNPTNPPGSYKHPFQMLMPVAPNARTVWCRPVVHGVKMPFGGTILSLDGTHSAMPPEITDFGMADNGATIEFNVPGGVFGEHQKITMPVAENIGYTIDVIPNPMPGKYYFLMLTASATKDAQIDIIAGDLFSGNIELDEKYRTYFWAKRFFSGALTSDDFILSFKSIAEYRLCGLVVGVCDSAVELETLTASLSHCLSLDQ